jgi:hypothetical protein
MPDTMSGINMPTNRAISGINMPTHRVISIPITSITVTRAVAV